MALLHGFACITHRGNQVVSGVAINILAAGLTVVLGTAWFTRGGQTPPLAGGERLMPIFFPVAGDNILVYAALLAVPLHLVADRAHALRAAAARGRRGAAGRRCGRHLGRLAALPRGAAVRPVRRPGRRLSLDRPERRLQPRHDGGAGLHRAGRHHLRATGGRSRRSAPACCSACSTPSPSACRA